MRIATAALLLLAILPALAAAQAYKCKLADGSTSFQDSPCPKEAKSSAPLTLTSPPPIGFDGPAKANAKAAAEAEAKAKKKTDPKGDPEADKAREKANKKIDEENAAAKAEVDAKNKAIACANAKQQLGVAKRYAPIYRTDEKGNRVYVEDANRAAVIAAAEERVAKECG